MRQQPYCRVEDGELLRQPTGRLRLGERITGRTRQLQLQSQLQSNQVEIANRERDIAGSEVKVGDYQGR